MFPVKNNPNIANSNRVFPGKGRGDTAFILTYLDSQIAEVFPHYCLSFSIVAIFRKKRVVKVGLKVQTLGPIFFMKTQILQFFSNNVFVCYSTTFDENFGNIGPYLGE